MEAITSSKESLSRTIDYMKKDIQYLLDKKKHLTDIEQINKLNIEKDRKIEELKIYTDKLRELNKIQKLKRESMIVSRELDSLEFMHARKKKSQDAISKAKESKESRDLARQEYEMFKLYENKYNKYDSKQVPGMLFLHNTVISKYGECPFIKINKVMELSELEDNVEIVSIEDMKEIISSIEKGRIDWLKSQEDGGKIYYELYDRIIIKKKYDEISIEIIKLDNECNKLLTNNLDDSQLELYNISIDIIEEYIKSSIKTKRLKEKLKTCIHNISILYSETKIPIHEYLTIKYKVPLVVNDIISERSTNMDKMYFIVGEMFNETLTNYKKHIDELEGENKYIINTIRNLNNEIYQFLKNTKNEKIEQKQEQVKQDGKYFKKWTSLTNDEKADRLKSYLEYYVRRLDNTFEEDNNQIENILKKIEQTVNYWIDNNLILYKNIKWNIKDGIIEDIKILKINNNTLELELTEINNKSVNKKVSQKTIITKETEIIINEQILYFIIKMKKDVKDNTKEDKEKCLEIIKGRLKIKKLSNLDKNKIIEKYDEIWKVVENNKSD